MVVGSKVKVSLYWSEFTRAIHCIVCKLSLTALLAIACTVS